MCTIRSELLQLKIVERHSHDLAQPRPEYGHATNAVCFIGQRQTVKNLYMDRRSFLISYDHSNDPTGHILGDILQSAGPVGAGINLEYFFSYTDPHHYGCGTKLPHNITGLNGVMNGHMSDLRTGLPWQMVEIHEPVRLLLVVESAAARLLKIASERPQIEQLVVKGWIQLAALDPDTKTISYFYKDKFIPHLCETAHFPQVSSSRSHYSGIRNHLGCAHIDV